MVNSILADCFYPFVYNHNCRSVFTSSKHDLIHATHDMFSFVRFKWLSGLNITKSIIVSIIQLINCI